MKGIIFFIAFSLVNTAAADFSIADNTKIVESDLNHIAIEASVDSNHIKPATHAADIHHGASHAGDSHGDNNSHASDSHAADSHSSDSHTSGHSDSYSPVSTSHHTAKTVKKIEVIHQTKAGTYGVLIAFFLCLIGLTYYLGRVNGKFHWGISARIALGFSIVLALNAGNMFIVSNALNSVGSEIEDLAKNMIPIQEKVTKISLHQLEQAVELERAFRYAEIKEAYGEKKFVESADKFLKLSHQVDEEFVEAEKSH